MRRFLLICICAFLPYDKNAYSNDMPLGQMNYLSRGGHREIINNIGIAWKSNGVTMYYGEFNSDSVGETISISSNSTSGYDFFVSSLTNGDDDLLSIQNIFNSGTVSGGTWESSWFQLNGQKFINSPYPDFYGYKVTRIDLTINNFTLLSPGSNPNHDGIWTDYSISGNFVIYGVPEPATFLLLGLGAVTLRKRRVYGIS